MAVSEYGENVTNGMYQRFTQCGYKQIVVLRTYVGIYGSFCSCFFEISLN